jgi:16S rRNA (guanine527-N7)-methyltransferase
MDNHYLVEQLALHKIQITDQQLQQLSQYIELLQRWNKAYNLIANAETKHIIDRHIIDSLLVMPYLQGPRLVDVGTGAGLPGIPLAIMCPHYQFTLLDSNGKKTRFITQAKVALKLSNLEVIQARVEEYHPELLFNAIISRAFASLEEMINLTKHLCAVNGKFIALKGDAVQSEIENIPAGFICERYERLPFFETHINRQIVIIIQSSMAKSP